MYSLTKTSKNRCIDLTVLVGTGIALLRMLLLVPSYMTCTLPTWNNNRYKKYLGTTTTITNV